MGRRYVALIGALFIMVGMVVCSTAKVMNTFIGGMALAGIGAGINELTALAVTSELAPTAKRGKYVAVLVFTILPFCPSVLWGQLIAAHAGWRWCGLLCAVWATIGFVLTLIFYFPPKRVNSAGLSKWEVFRRIDFLGGFLSIAGMILFMAGIQWGGYQVRSSNECQKRERYGLTLVAVQMEVVSCTCTLDHWCYPLNCFCLLASQSAEQVSHVPAKIEQRAENNGVDLNHHFHFWGKFLFDPHVVSDISE